MEQIVKGKFISRIAWVVGMSVIIIMIYIQVFEYNSLYDKYSLVLFGVGIISSAVECIRHIQLKKYLRNNDLRKIQITNKWSRIFLVFRAVAFILFIQSFTKYIHEIVLVGIILIPNYIFSMLSYEEFHIDNDYIYYAGLKAKIKEIVEIEDSHGFTVIIKGKKWTIEVKCSSYELQQNLIKDINKFYAGV